MAGIERMETRLEAAASLVEHAVALLEEREGEVRRLVAAAPSRESELEQKLQAAEQQIAEMKAQLEAQPEVRTEVRAEAQPSARKTVPAATAQFLAKQGIALEHVEAGALDAALSGLSLEQRIAVKAQLLRAGLAS
jgi:ABC-type Fe3+-citrate transport system substrate-binding protein